MATPACPYKNFCPQDNLKRRESGLAQRKCPGKVCEWSLWLQKNCIRDIQGMKERL